jgi:hypothetical protein
MAIPDGRTRLSLLDGTATGGNRGGGSRRKDICCDLLTSHHGQWGGVSFKISGEEMRFLSQLTEDQKSKVSGLTPRYLYRRGKMKRPFGTHIRDSAWRARRLGLFTIQSTQRPTHYEWGPSPHINNVYPPGVARQQGR